MDILTNPFRNAGGFPGLTDIPFPKDDAGPPLGLVNRCPKAHTTPLIIAKGLAQSAGVDRLWLKDERGRMGLGSFKALGAAHVIACDHANGQAEGRTYVTASAGNHGMSVAAGASAFGAKALVYIAETVPDSFADRLRSTGAQVVREGAIYEDSMAAAARDAETNGWQLLSDSSWPGYLDRPLGVMEGYLILMAEAIDQVDHTPTHVILQAGVGGLAAACAALARKAWVDAPRIIVVEPSEAAALYRSIEAGRFVTAEGGVSDMGRLDCKEASLIALKGLARDADDFVLISEAEALAGAKTVADAGYASTPSGCAGVSALLAAGGGLGLSDQSRVLCILSEGVES